MKRLKRAFKNVNLYMAVSALIVLISLIVMALLLWGGARAKEEQEDMLIVLESEEEDIREAAIGVAAIGMDSDETEMVAASESSIVSEKTEAWIALETEEQPVAEPEEIELPEPVSEEVVIEVVQPLPEEAEVQENLQPDQAQAAPEPPKQDVPKTEESKESEESEVAEPPKDCNHSWIFSSYYQEPTCSSGGLENQLCVHCGAGQTMPGTATGQHVFVTETEGDCCGDEIVICKDCNYREVRGKNPSKHIDVEDGFCYGCGMKISPPAE